MKLKFIGATENVTGSKHLLITGGGKQILLDCGLYQGAGKETDVMNRHLMVDPSQIHCVILSHAHIDHSGNLPSLVKQGFTGKIYCTEATLSVSKILLMDSAHIHESDIKFLNKKREENGLPLLKPLYSVNDVELCLKQFEPIAMNTDYELDSEITFKFTPVGHITGSAAINITSKFNGQTTHLAYTGDVGRYNDLLLKAPEVFPQADYIICESTYGNRLHETNVDAEKKFLEIVLNTCLKKNGKLIIPAFSLGRTQEILFVLNKLINKHLLPDIKVYVDSPLSASATTIVRQHSEYFNDELKNYIKTDPEPFDFKNLKYIREAEESKALNYSDKPCIIISASGMCDAGRVKHHLRHCISDKRNTVLIVGYCAPKTLGSKLLNGEKKVHIFGDDFDVKADIESIHSYSAHADYSELIRFLDCQDKTRVKDIFLVHGEEDAKKSFKEKLMATGYKTVIIPRENELFNLG